MNNDTEIITGTGENVPETLVEVLAEPTPIPAPVESRYEYQPTDELGRPMGGVQVILHTNPGELASKLTEQNTLLLRKLRAETRKNRLGIYDQETIEEAAPRFSQPVEFKPKELTPDQKVSLALRLGVSPEDFDTATDELFETKFGAKPGDLIHTIQKLEEKEIAREAVAEAEAFKSTNPDFYFCSENGEAITNWVARYNLAPVRGNFQRAFNTLREAGILIEKPTTAPAPTPVVAPVVAEYVIEEPVNFVAEIEPPAPRLVSRVPVSLSRTNTDESGVSPTTSGSDIVYEVRMLDGQKRRFTGLAAINAMTGDEYRRRTLSDPSFQRKEAALEKDAAERRARRTQRL